MNTCTSVPVPNASRKVQFSANVQILGTADGRIDRTPMKRTSAPLNELLEIRAHATSTTPDANQPHSMCGVNSRWSGHSGKANFQSCSTPGTWSSMFLSMGAPSSNYPV
eukprot:CAMPEP_0182481578 /NCGR_PEP_ID=MMETSP1319-20130603/37569_1 /TAXON_ID=172717 /ORGANISM="Bolidomonas pacifica, Strain RCC208" /LENGTH=108 /DNA_ID=CAMNT_0024683199 /DNA_START=117 /DNA_END=443 /DNA_ORIENTATION=+